MDEAFKIPPKSLKHLTETTKLPEIFKGLVGSEFLLTGKTRTDGANIRKLIANELLKNGLPEGANPSEFEIVPPKKKGVPKMLRELIDSYTVTSGEAYNLQVWNRIPNCKTVLVKYDLGASLKCNDVRYVFVKIDSGRNNILSIIILTADYIESHFGKFGKPTIKHQLLISNKARNQIYSSESKILSYPDSKKLSYLISGIYKEPGSSIANEPSMQNFFSIHLLIERVAKNLIGKKLDNNSTKNRGQALERMTLELLGYKMADNENLVGGFPDIPNQLLEVKVQDTQTVDLGRFTPEKEEVIVVENNLTTFDVRYLIALTNSQTGIIEGIILAPGEKLGEIFTYVSDVSYKCQRSIRMSFFNSFEGQCVFNP
ncbi:MAG: nuclease [Bacteroidetes bacterium]|nr:nuclease [Bacteroidota bacterium]MBU1720740.1 nuclease [Bacteroidota bacterium]